MSSTLQKCICILVISAAAVGTVYAYAQAHIGNSTHQLTAPNSTQQRGIRMDFNNNVPNRFGDNSRCFRSLHVNKEVLELEEQLRARNLLWDKDVQWLVTTAALNTRTGSQWAIAKLKDILKAESIEDMRTANIWGPAGPVQLLNTGNFHLFDQVDGIPWKIKSDALTRGMLLTGLQGGGKTMLLIYLCHQLATANPATPFFILDPKMGLKDWAGYLNATYIESSDISIDFTPPPGLTIEQFLQSLMSPLGDIVGLVYGTEILQEAAQICIDLKKQYQTRTGKDTGISLFDLYQAVPFVNDVSKGRRLGYREAVSTSLGRILTGSGNLFKCRRGIDLKTLFNHNVILGCRSITDDFAAKFLSLYLLYWLYESERFSPPCDNLKRVLIFDDASRYLSNAAALTQPVPHHHLPISFHALDPAATG